MTLYHVNIYQKDWIYKKYVFNCDFSSENLNWDYRTFFFMKANNTSKLKPPLGMKLREAEMFSMQPDTMIWRLLSADLSDTIRTYLYNSENQTTDPESATNITASWNENILSGSDLL